MRHTRRVAQIAVGLAVVAVGVILPAPRGALSATYSLPAVARVQGTLPGNVVQPIDTNRLCLMRLDLQGTDVETRSFCYWSSGYNPPPSLPLSDFLPLYHHAANGAYDPQTGIILLPYIPCSEVLPQAGLGVSIVVQVGKGGSAGTAAVIVTTDTSGPNYNCDDGVNSPPSALSFTPLDMPPATPTHDEDGDGCTDYQELGDTAGAGGLRDPFNPYDYYDVNHDGAISIPVDVLQVSQAFGVPANYVWHKDRGVTLGPNSWNKLGPNKSIDVPGDVLGVSNQFGHACPHTIHPSTWALGPHPTTVSAKITAEQLAPFAMSVGTTAGYPSTGQSLIGSETLAYNQNAGTCGGGFNPATQFCVTARPCDTAADEDVDGWVNDGCPQVGGSEDQGQCAGSVNDDPADDALVNDGCPPNGAAEGGAACSNSVDDDGDGLVNDGCPVAGSKYENPWCADNADNDGDGKVNDGCPWVGTLSEAGTQLGAGAIVFPKP